MAGLEGGRAKRATIHDVARMANVAVGTVSRYLNGQEVRSGNRARIERAIEETSFRRNASAAFIRQDRSQFVGFLVPRYDEFHARLLERVVAALRRHGRAVIPLSHGDRESTLNEAFGFFSEQRVGAMIMSGDLDYQELTRRIAASDLPVVLYNNDIRGLLVDRVLVDNASATKVAMRHLINLGHEAIAFLAGRDGDSSAEEREAGYRAALDEAGIDFQDRYLVRGDWQFHGGYLGAQRLMNLDGPPTALLSANYLMTYGALEWLKQAGIDVPGSLSLISFDDCDLFRLLGDGITAISQPLDMISGSIVEMVRSRISDPEISDIRKVTLRCELVQRESTARPSAKQVGTNGKHLV